MMVMEFQDVQISQRLRIKEIFLIAIKCFQILICLLKIIKLTFRGRRMINQIILSQIFHKNPLESIELRGICSG